MECHPGGDWHPGSGWGVDLMYIYIPRTQLTSIFEGQPSKTRPFSIKTRVIWVLGIHILYIQLYTLVTLCGHNNRNCFLNGNSQELPNLETLTLGTTAPSKLPTEALMLGCVES